MPDYKPLFSQEFLSQYLSDFNLGHVVGINRIKSVLDNWRGASKKGKLDLIKEESIKSRFLMEFFGEILGFNYKNTDQWLYHEELKSKVGQTKPDGALGTFYISGNKLHSDVRIVIEVKSSKVSLDAKQRGSEISPVDQAFLYATKMEGKCKWVVVTNLKEIRFYRANDQSRYQRYLLADLAEENLLKEFIFLFHRDRFDNHVESTTYKLLQIQEKDVPRDTSKMHVVDDLYFSLKRFDKLSFISPLLIANLKPFNVLDQYVWHYSPGGKLFTLNHDIYVLIGSVSFEEGKVNITEAYAKLLKKAKVVDPISKVEFIFEKLYRCRIYEIAALKDLEQTVAKERSTIGFSYRHPVHVNAQNGNSLKIALKKELECDCIACNYRSLDFRKLIKKLEMLESDTNQLSDTEELAYGHYLIATDNYKKSYKLLKRLEIETKGSDKYVLTYFLTKFNLLYHHNLFFDDQKKIKKELASIDLDRVINNEVDLYVDDEVRRLLVDIKENKVFNDALNSCRETVQDIREMKQLYDHGGEMSGPNYTMLLNDQYLMVYAHFQQNLIVHDVYVNHRKFVELVFEGLILSLQTKGAGLTHINEFYLTEAALFFLTENLKKILAEIDVLPITEEQKEKFLKKATNFFSSYSKVGIFGDAVRNEIMVKQLLNHNFHDKFNNIFNNICTILPLLSISKEEFLPLTDPITWLIEVDDTLRWWDVEQLGKVLISGDFFSEVQLFKMLKAAIGPHRYPKGNKYTRLIKDICTAFSKFHPTFTLTDDYLIRAAVLSCHHAGMVDLMPLIDLWKIVNAENRALLIVEFETELDKNFNENLFEMLIKKEILPFNRRDYLMKLAQEVNKTKVIGFSGFVNGVPKYTHFVHLNFLTIPYILNLEFTLPEFQILDTLSLFERWLLNPVSFDYGDFDPRWIKLCNSFVFKRLKGNKNIAFALENSLAEKFDRKLSEIYFTYFFIQK